MFAQSNETVAYMGTVEGILSAVDAMLRKLVAEAGLLPDVDPLPAPEAASFIPLPVLAFGTIAVLFFLMRCKQVTWQKQSSLRIQGS